MLRKHSASSRLVRAGVFGLVTLVTGAFFTTDSAEARRHYRSRHVVHSHDHHQDSNDYSPKFSSIILDGNSGAVLTATSPDAIRHPASLTKIMTLYLLFERLESGQVKLDAPMSVSENASEQDPTKLGLRPGETIKVEDAIKGLVTRSANDAAVVIAEAISGSEDEFARMMTRKAHALGMSHTIYRNASGLPNDEQVTTARDQATLGRAIQERFPRYYRYFSTATFNYHGESIRNHNHLLGSVEGVDGIKTGYTRASGFNLVTSLHRANHFLVGVVMGGRSGGSRDAIMRSLLAENLEKGSTTRTIAAIAERHVADRPAEADEPTLKAPNTETSKSQAVPAQSRATPGARASATVAARLAQAAAAAPAPQPKLDPAPLTSGAIESQPLVVIGSSEPMKPVRVKTVQVKAGQLKLASASSSQPPTPVTGAVPPTRHDLPETSSEVVSNAETEAPKADAAKSQTDRADLAPQPPRVGSGSGVPGAVPTSSVPSSSASQAMAYVDPAPQQPQAVQQQQPQAARQNGSPVHTGWIVQVGALENESEAQKRLEAARNQAHGLLANAEPFTEPVIATGDRTLYRARFAGLGRDQAEAVCRTLKRSDISCIAVKN
ncbi:MAG: D-alanyl-D-alanine carboxypeptidase [Bradyrhizobium sp.]|nr:D-alanyl-D-alanine carboxypeptidase [Bradyrhizobium sp.]